jgi:hypothetical protein
MSAAGVGGIARRAPPPPVQPPIEPPERAKGRAKGAGRRLRDDGQGARRRLRRDGEGEPGEGSDDDRRPLWSQPAMSAARPLSMNLSPRPWKALRPTRPPTMKKARRHEPSQPTARLENDLQR